MTARPIAGALEKLLHFALEEASLTFIGLSQTTHNDKKQAA